MSEFISYRDVLRFIHAAGKPLAAHRLAAAADILVHYDARLGRKRQLRLEGIIGKAGIPDNAVPV